MDLILLFARLFLGLGLAVHGAQKLAGWFGGHGLAGTGGFFEMLGFRPGRVFALAAGIAEAGGGLLLAFGLFGPLGPAAMISAMLVATLTVHLGHGFLATNNGIEMPMLYAMGALVLAFTGPGVLSLDALLGLLWLSETPYPSIAVILAAVLAFINVALAHRAKSAQSAAVGAS